jgi:hypothetical protein
VGLTACDRPSTQAVQTGEVPFSINNDRSYTFSMEWAKLLEHETGSWASRPATYFGSGNNCQCVEVLDNGPHLLHPVYNVLRNTRHTLLVILLQDDIGENGWIGSRRWPATSLVVNWSIRQGRRCDVNNAKGKCGIRTVLTE